MGASIASRPTACKRTTIFDRSSCFVQMTDHQEVAQVGIATVCTSDIILNSVRKKRAINWLLVFQAKLELIGLGMYE